MRMFNFIFVNLLFSFNILLNNVNSIKMPSYVLYNKNNIVGDCSWVLDKSFINHYRYYSNHNIICHKDIMIFYNLNYRLPFSSYAIHSSQQVNNLLGAVFLARGKEGSVWLKTAIVACLSSLSLVCW